MARIWILWDGQLGQLTAQAAEEMWHETVVFGAAGPNAPAAQVSEAIAITYADTADALEAIESAQVDVVTPEWGECSKSYSRRYRSSMN